MTKRLLCLESNRFKSCFQHQLSFSQGAINKHELLIKAPVRICKFMDAGADPHNCNYWKFCVHVLRRFPAGSMNSSFSVRPDGSVFHPIKFIVSASAPGPEIKILHAKPDFHLLFGYGPEDMPLPLNLLYSYSNSRVALANIERCVYSGEPLTAFVNLVDKDHAILSCYVILSSAQEATDPSLLVQNGQPVTSNIYSVFTIHSVNVVGNTFNGVLTG